MSFPASLPTAALSGKAATALALAALAVGGASAATISSTASGGASGAGVSVASHASSSQGANTGASSNAFRQQVEAQIDNGVTGKALSSWVTANNPGDAHADAAGQNASGHNPTDAPPATPVGSSTSHPTGAPVSHPGH